MTKWHAWFYKHHSTTRCPATLLHGLLHEEACTNLINFYNTSIEKDTWTEIISRKFNITHPTILQYFMHLLLFLLKLSSYQSARQWHISCNVLASHVFCFSRQDFMRPRLPVRWSSLGLPIMLSFSGRMCRSVVVDLSFFFTETLLCGCQNRPVPCTAPGWPEALSRGCPLLPGCPRMLERWGCLCWCWLGPDSVVLGLENEEMSLSIERMLLVFYALAISLLLCYEYKMSSSN